MDNQLRRIERRALAGDAEAERLWRRLCGRIGLYFRDHQPNEILTEWEEIQADYDEIWWHRRKALRWGWDWEPMGGLVKAHHTWGHRGWNNRNSKRKTLRTHRDGSRRNYKIRHSRNEEMIEELDPKRKRSERRRKKRFGGREHRSYRWVWNPETDRFKLLWTFTEPRLDE